jgi:hypothetical protein
LHSVNAADADGDALAVAVDPLAGPQHRKSNKKERRILKHELFIQRMWRFASPFFNIPRPFHFKDHFILFFFFGSDRSFATNYKHTIPSDTAACPAVDTTNSVGYLSTFLHTHIPDDDDDDDGGSIL